MRVMVIIGSVREGRRAEMVANWVVGQLKQDSELEIDLADLKEIDLPFFNEAVTPDEAHGQFQNPKGTEWSARLAKAEAYIMLVAEYNHGPTPVLKNAIDWAYDSWLNKPVGFVSYGGMVGGVRAVEQLKQIVMNVMLVPINNVVLIPRAGQAFDEQGQLKEAERANQSLVAMVADLKNLQRHLAS